MINFDSLRKVEGVNSRVSYDLRYSGTTEKFSFSQPAFNRLKIDKNGLNMFKDGEGNVALTVQPNEESSIHTGREGYDKGLVFTARGLASALGVEEDTHFKLEEVENAGITYYIPVPMNTEEEDAPITGEVEEEEDEMSELPVGMTEMNEESAEEVGNF